MNEQYLEKLADLAVKEGVNLQPGQKLVINFSTDHLPLARLAARKAWKAGAADVILRLSDDQMEHDRLLLAPEELFETLPEWKKTLLEDSASEGAAYLSLDGEDPDLMADTDPLRSMKQRRMINQNCKRYRSGLDNGLNAWSIIPCATEAWAAKVYPELNEKDGMDALWSDLFSFCRIDDNDAADNWNDHDRRLQNRCTNLNRKQFKAFHYTNDKGTDLMVEMPKEHVFMGGSEKLQNGRRILCNIPTEEVFCAPQRDAVNGHLVAVLPLNHGGKLVKDFWLDFKDGKVVDYGASEGLDVLKSIVEADDGSDHLGEIAMVPVDSPIAMKKRIYYNTLIDENASCHFALGSAYRTCVKGGETLDNEAAREKGLNTSAMHVDFMVGDESLNIVGITEDGKEIPVMTGGLFESWLDEEVQ